MTTNQPDVAEVPGLASLKWLFAEAVGKRKVNSAHDAHLQLQKATSVGEKLKIIDAQFASWQQGCAAAIEEYFSQYVELGCAHHDLLNSDPLEWAEARIWDVLSNLCGATNPNQQESGHFEPVRWWLAVATEFNHNAATEPTKIWHVPRWLNRSGNSAARDSLFHSFLGRLTLTCFDVLYAEKERARFRIALKSASSVEPRRGASPDTASWKTETYGRIVVPTRARTPEDKVLSGAVQEDDPQDASMPPSQPFAEKNQDAFPPLLSKYRSEIKRAILIQLAKTPSASDLEICRALDGDGSAEFPKTWQSVQGERAFASAYLNGSKRSKIEKAISKVRADLRRAKLLPRR